MIRESEEAIALAADGLLVCLPDQNLDWFRGDPIGDDL